eukprot:m.108057 g.108057  ORF g.108057 m.108057 type:complete len:502 (+) comp16944_c1_seq1:146-1651(+)
MKVSAIVLACLFIGILRMVNSHVYPRQASSVHNSPNLDPLPRISVVKGSAETRNQQAQFYAAGKAIKLRGSDYIRLNRTSIGTPLHRPTSPPRLFPSETPLPAYHSTFSVGKYNRTQAEAALASMQALGFNMARVFIDDGRTYCGITMLSGTSMDAENTESDAHNMAIPVLPCTAASARPNGVGGAWDDKKLSREYMDNFADFVRLATQYKVWLMPTFQRFPCTARFVAMTHPRNMHISDGNADYLDAPTVSAKAAYLQEFSSELRARIGSELMSTVLAYSLENEARAYGNEIPFSDQTLTAVKFSDGHEYNMSDARERRAGLDASFAYWASTVGTAVRSIDDKALVTVGMFTYYAVGHASPVAPGPTSSSPDPRFPPDPSHLSTHGNVDYLDIHVYPTGEKFNLDQDLASENYDAIDQQKVPVLMGEFGAFKRFYPTASDAAHKLREIMLSTCREYGFQGWLAWTWDTWEQGWMLWNMQDQKAFIAHALSPELFNDTCFV